jgi:hypothetical protein
MGDNPDFSNGSILHCGDAKPDKLRRFDQVPRMTVNPTLKACISSPVIESG